MIARTLTFAVAFALVAAVPLVGAAMLERFERIAGEPTCASCARSPRAARGRTAVPATASGPWSAASAGARSRPGVRAGQGRHLVRTRCGPRPVHRFERLHRED